ncbi:hypothetical protein ACFC0X_19700 [Paenibacillus chitinolyticus]|uniref:hypothetical protein n=1 Tax=Paenibacillus chitinolyticus TaxID=79263 RepID=UPI0035E0AACC
MNSITAIYLLYFACFLLIVLFCFFVKVKIWIRVLVSIFMVLVTMSIVIWIGHTDWNRLSQLEANINKLGGIEITVNDSSNKETLDAIKNAPKPLKVTVKGSRMEPKKIGEAYWNRVEINGKEYNVKDICYTGPLNWTPFQTWTVLEVQ